MVRVRANRRFQCHGRQSKSRRSYARLWRAAGRPAGIIELNRCSSRMRITSRLLSGVRKSPRIADNKLNNPSAVASLFIPRSCAPWSSTPRRSSTPSTCASRRTVRAYSTPTKSSSKLAARLLLPTDHCVRKRGDLRGPSNSRVQLRRRVAILADAKDRSICCAEETVSHV